MKKLVLAALAAAALPAAAQDAPVKVLYQPAQGRNAYLVDKVMALVLERPGFEKVAQPDAQTLVVSVPQRAARINSGDDVSFTFTLGFMRNDAAIGEAEEACNTGKLPACADLVASDLTSADAMRR